MGSLAAFEKMFQHYLRQTATVYIYSTPNFILEAGLALIILLIYLYLHSEISRINKKTLRLKPNSVYCKTGSIEKESGGTSVTHYREVFAVTENSSTTIAYKRLGQNFNMSSNSQMGWVLPTTPIEKSGHQAPVEKKSYLERLINLTPEQYVKIDKERKMREKELDSYMTSLSTLCKNVLKRKYSARTLSRQVEMARESLQCNKMSIEGKYLGFKTEAMTRSLFNMLEQMIINSSLQNPLPFKGDITTLALDVADMTTDTHYFAKDVAKWDTNNSSSCVSEDTDETESGAEKTIRGENWGQDEIRKEQWH